MSEILKVENLYKRFGDRIVVNGINFTVHKGEILCILGPNGAGKSTTINMLTGSLGFDEGSIHSVFAGGEIHSNLTEYKKKLGIVPQDLAIYEDLTAEQNVMFFASPYGLKGADLKEGCRFALDLAGLSERAKEKAATFSGGMKRRLNIACSLAHRPELLIMDEPTVGIDPQSRNHILDCIKKLQQEGMTIIYTTHYMEEVETISTRIIVVDQGKVIACGTKEQLKARMEGEKRFYIEAADLDSFCTDPLYRIEGVTQVRKEEGRLEISTIREIENLDRIIGVLIEQEKKISSIASRSVSLESVFLDLTGRSLRD